MTIAQWCYIKLNSTSAGKQANKNTARTLLSNEGHLEEIQKSYWKYLKTWENEEWEQLKKTKGWVDRDDTACMTDLIHDNAYNPLEDTRPYYYATYQNVRGTS